MFQSSSTALVCVPGAAQERPVDKHLVEISRRTSVSMVKIPWCFVILTCVTAQLVDGLKGIWREGRLYLVGEIGGGAFWCFFFLRKSYFAPLRKAVFRKLLPCQSLCLEICDGCKVDI